MTATNYARNRHSGQLVFIGPGEQPRDEHLSIDWAWHLPPKPHPRAKFALTIGESQASYAERIRKEKS